MKKVTQQDGQSANIVSENLEKLKELFPDAFSEDSVDFEVLRQLLEMLQDWMRARRSTGSIGMERKKPARLH